MALLKFFSTSALVDSHHLTPPGTISFSKGLLGKGLLAPLLFVFFNVFHFDQTKKHNRFHVPRSSGRRHALRFHPAPPRPRLPWPFFTRCVLFDVSFFLHPSLPLSFSLCLSSGNMGQEWGGRGDDEEGRGGKGRRCFAENCFPLLRYILSFYNSFPSKIFNTATLP